MENSKNNVTLIGMAGVGKSYVGKQVADEMGYEHVEVDDLIQKFAREKGIDEDSLLDRDFIELEESIVLELAGKENCVFVTGGSVVYSEKAMEFLKSVSKIVYLEDSAENIEARFNERIEKGDDGKIVGLEGKTFGQLLEERRELYEKYADAKINVSAAENVQELAKEIVKACQEKGSEAQAEVHKLFGGIR